MTPGPANWGFVPLSDNEMRDIQKNVMKFADPDLAFFIYYEDEPAAVCVIFPDINPLLKRLNGRIGLLGLLKVAHLSAGDQRIAVV